MAAGAAFLKRRQGTSECSLEGHPGAGDGAAVCMAVAKINKQPGFLAVPLVLDGAACPAVSHHMPAIMDPSITPTGCGLESLLCLELVGPQGPTPVVVGVVCEVGCRTHGGGRRLPPPPVNFIELRQRQFVVQRSNLDGGDGWGWSLFLSLNGEFIMEVGGKRLPSGGGG